MSRRRSEQPTDRWHKSALGPGEQPCRGGDGCRGAKTPPTREHGQGMRWLATWTEVTDGDPRPKRKSFPDYGQALYFQGAMRKGVRDKTMPPGTVAREGVVTLAWYFEHEFMPDTEGNRAEGGNDKVRTQFRTGIKPFLGHLDLADLQHMGREIRRWQVNLRDGVAPPVPALDKHGRPLPARAYALGTIDVLFLLLSQICEQAKGDWRTGMLQNPCKLEKSRLDKAERGKRVRGRRKASWETPMIVALYRADTVSIRAQRGSPPAWDRYRAVPLVAATTGGMRLGEVLGLGTTLSLDGPPGLEALGLDTEDVDWDARLITMNYSLTRSGSVLHFTDGKSENAQRVMTSNPIALNALRQHAVLIEPIEVTLPLEVKRGPGSTRGKPMDQWPRLTRRLIFSTGGQRRTGAPPGGPVVVPAFQSAARFALHRAGLLPAREHESRAVRGADGRYAANGGADPKRRRVDQRYENPSEYGIHSHAMRGYWHSLMEHRGIPLSVIQDEVGHERTRLSDGTEPGDGYAAVTLNYIRPIPGAEREMWQDKIRSVIDAEFGPLLPELR